MWLFCSAFWGCLLQSERGYGCAHHHTDRSLWLLHTGVCVCVCVNVNRKLLFLNHITIVQISKLWYHWYHWYCRTSSIWKMMLLKVLGVWVWRLCLTSDISPSVFDVCVHNDPHRSWSICSCVGGRFPMSLTMTWSWTRATETSPSSGASRGAVKWDCCPYSSTTTSARWHARTHDQVIH